MHVAASFGCRVGRDPKGTERLLPLDRTRVNPYFLLIAVNADQLYQEAFMELIMGINSLENRLRQGMEKSATFSLHLHISYRHVN